MWPVCLFISVVAHIAIFLLLGVENGHPAGLPARAFSLIEFSASVREVPLRETDVARADVVPIAGIAGKNSSRDDSNHRDKRGAIPSPEKQLALEEVKTELTKRLQSEKAQDEIQSIYDAVEAARDSQTKYEDIAKAQSIPFLVIPAVSAAGLDPAGKDVVIPDKTDVLKAAYESDVGVENNALTPKDGYFWYEVREVIPSALKPFDKVKDQVKSDVLARKIRDLLTERGAKLVTNLTTGAKLETLASDAKAEIKTVQGLKRNEAAAEFDIPAVTALFSVPPTGFASSLEGDGRSAKIMQSQPVLAVPFDIKAPASKELVKTIAAAQSKDILTTYLKALQGQIGVSINNTLWQQVSGTTQPSP